jgi:hypothetical protein
MKVLAVDKTREEILKERRRLRAEYGELFDTTAKLLFRHDPIGISFDQDTEDEYESEAGTILPRLHTCRSAADVVKVIHEEFVRWFDPIIAGPEDRSARIPRNEPLGAT